MSTYVGDVSTIISLGLGSSYISRMSICKVEISVVIGVNLPKMALASKCTKISSIFTKLRERYLLK